MKMPNSLMASILFPQLAYFLGNEVFQGSFKLMQVRICQLGGGQFWKVCSDAPVQRGQQSTFV